MSKENLMQSITFINNNMLPRMETYYSKDDIKLSDIVLRKAYSTGSTRNMMHTMPVGVGLQSKYSFFLSRNVDDESLKKYRSNSEVYTVKGNNYISYKDILIDYVLSVDSKETLKTIYDRFRQETYNGDLSKLDNNLLDKEIYLITFSLLKTIYKKEYRDTSEFNKALEDGRVIPAEAIVNVLNDIIVAEYGSDYIEDSHRITIAITAFIMLNNIVEELFFRNDMVYMHVGLIDLLKDTPIGKCAQKIENVNFSEAYISLLRDIPKGDIAKYNQDKDVLENAHMCTVTAFLVFDKVLKNIVNSLDVTLIYNIGGQGPYSRDVKTLIYKYKRLLEECNYYLKDIDNAVKIYVYDFISHILVDDPHFRNFIIHYTDPQLEASTLALIDNEIEKINATDNSINPLAKTALREIIKTYTDKLKNSKNEYLRTYFNKNIFLAVEPISQYNKLITNNIESSYSTLEMALSLFSSDVESYLRNITLYGDDISSLEYAETPKNTTKKNKNSENVYSGKINITPESMIYKSAVSFVLRHDMEKDIIVKNPNTLNIIAKADYLLKRIIKTENIPDVFSYTHMFGNKQIKLTNKGVEETIDDNLMSVYTGKDYLIVEYYPMSVLNIDNIKLTSEEIVNKLTKISKSKIVLIYEGTQFNTYKALLDINYHNMSSVSLIFETVPYARLVKKDNDKIDLSLKWSSHK